MLAPAGGGGALRKRVEPALEPPRCAGTWPAAGVRQRSASPEVGSPSARRGRIAASEVRSKAGSRSRSREPSRWGLGGSSVEFVPAWLCGASFAACAALVLAATWHRRDAELEARFAALPSWIHGVPLGIFSASAVVNGVSLLHLQGKAAWCAKLCCLLATNTAVASALHLSASTRVVARTPWNAAVMPIRYAAWAHSTPCLLALLASLTSVQRPGQLQLAIALDVAMLATGLAGCLVKSRLLAAVFILHSSLFMAALLIVVWGWYTVAAAAAQPGSAQRTALRFARAHTMALWCAFPCIVVFEALCPARLLAAELMYGCADVGAKAVWAALLGQGNALVAESQRQRSREYLADVSSAELLARLRAALTLRDRLRAAASHELRTPLNIIVGLADKVLSASSAAGGPAQQSPRISHVGHVPRVSQVVQGMPGGSRLSQPGMTSQPRMSSPGGGAPRVSGAAAAVETARALAAIKAAGVRLLALVEDLADDASSAIAPRRMHLAYEQVSVADVVASVMPLHEGLQRPGVRLVNRVMGGDAALLPPLYADRVRLSHALHRLLASASRDTVAGSIIVSAEVLRVEGAPRYAQDGADSDEGGAAAEEQEGTVIAIHVTDTGSGGATFVRASSASSTDGGVDAELGAGLLGMQGVSDIAEAHGGTLLVTDTPGVGTRATLALPLVVPAQRADSPGLFLRRSCDGRSSLGSDGQRRSSSDGGRYGGSDLHRRSGEGRAGPQQAPLAALATSSSLYAPTASPLSPGSTSPPASAAVEAAARIAAASGAEQLEWLELDAAASQLPLVLCVGGVSGQAALAQLLSGTFAVRCARDAHSAISMLADGEARRVWPDCIMLHASAGIGAVELLREAGPPATPAAACIVLLADHAADGSAGEWLDVGADDVLRSPLSKDMLAVRVNTQLRLRAAAQEAAASSALLRRMLPEGVISRLMSGQQMIAESMENITVLFSDVVSFTTLASRVPTTALIVMLNELFSLFDALCDKWGCYKVESACARLLLRNTRASVCSRVRRRASQQSGTHSW